MLIFFILSTFSPKPYMDIGLGLGWIHMLSERENAPCHTSPIHNVCVYGEGALGVGLFSRINLGLFINGYTMFGDGVKDKTNERGGDEWNGFSFGGIANVTFPVFKNLSCVLGAKYGKFCEHSLQQDYIDTTFCDESYSVYGFCPELKLQLDFDLPPENFLKAWTRWDVSHKPCNLGTIGLKEETSGKTYYEDLTINEYSLGFHGCSIDSINTSRGGRGGELGARLLFLDKSDGRKDGLIIFNCKISD